MLKHANINPKFTLNILKYFKNKLFKQTKYKFALILKKYIEKFIEVENTKYSKTAQFRISVFFANNATKNYQRCHILCEPKT